MIRLVKTDRKFDLSWTTPWLILGVVLFFTAIITAHLIGRHHETSFTPCLFKNLSGKPCPLCGGTRASFQLATGNPIVAFKFNPMVTIVLPSLVGLFLLKTLAGRRITFSGWLAKRPLLWILAIAIALLNWVYVWRVL